MPSVQKTVLSNGISVITEEMPGVESCSLGIWVNAGSRNETRAINGVSHFIEHLLFKGTKKRTALDISREIESVGGKQILRGEDRFARRRPRQIEKLLAQGAGKKSASERRREQASVEFDKEIGARALGELALAVEEDDLVAS